MADLGSLGEVELDALRELGNIGVGHAATSLSQMLGKAVDMSVPKVIVTKVSELHNYVDAEKIVAGVITALNDLEQGETGYLYITFPDGSAKKIAEILLGDASDEEMVNSAIMEIGNILSSSFCDATAEMLGVTLLPTPPSFAIDYAMAVVDAIIAQISERSEHLIIFETELKEEEDAIEIFVMLIPSENFLNYILKMLGMVQ